VTDAALVKNGETRHGIEQGCNDERQVFIEDACALGAAEYKQMRVGGGGRLEGEKLGAHGNAGDFAIVEPRSCRGKVDGRGLHFLPHQAVGQAGHGVGFKGHGGHVEANRGGHGRTGGVTADAEDDRGLNSRMRRLQAEMLRGRSRSVRRRVARDTFLSGPTSTRRRLKPASGTRRISMPRAVPTNSTLAA